ncbi:MAG: hypothetical protein IJT73_04610 [Selenomonadaceae bacterium]|nr:hypothetical protein [Selenomonadaceae bacterium]
MAQLGDLEKILAAAKEIGENFQKEVEQLREENELLKIEVEELRDENKILRDENEKIYIEMNQLRNAKEEIKVANEAFSNSLSHLVKQLEEEHAKTMGQINQRLNDGLQKFVVDYVNKIRGEAADSEEVTEVDTLDKYSDSNTDIIVEEETALEVQDKAKKPKMQYAAFYAEEAEVEKDDNGNPIQMKNLVKPHKK